MNRLHELHLATGQIERGARSSFTNHVMRFANEDNRDLRRFREVDSLLEAQKLGGDDPMRFLVCDREFHLAIYRACGNALLSDFVTDLYTYMMNHRRIAMSRPGAIDASYQDHAEIVAALKRRDRDAVIAAFRHHLTRIYETTRELLAKVQQGPEETGVETAR